MNGLLGSAWPCCGWLAGHAGMLADECVRRAVRGRRQCSGLFDLLMKTGGQATRSAFSAHTESSWLCLCWMSSSRPCLTSWVQHDGGGHSLHGPTTHSLNVQGSPGVSQVPCPHILGGGGTSDDAPHSALKPLLLQQLLLCLHHLPHHHRRLPPPPPSPCQSLSS